MIKEILKTLSDGELMAVNTMKTPLQEMYNIKQH